MFFVALALSLSVQFSTLQYNSVRFGMFQNSSAAAVCFYTNLYRMFQYVLVQVSMFRAISAQGSKFQYVSEQLSTFSLFLYT